MDINFINYFNESGKAHKTISLKQIHEIDYGFLAKDNFLKLINI